MRTGHTLSNSHLYKIGVKESPACECGQLEDLDHILFKCPINVIPGVDLYKEIASAGTPTPFKTATLLRSRDLKVYKLINMFLAYNRIKL